MSGGHGAHGGQGGGGKPIQVLGAQQVAKALEDATDRLINAVAAGLYLEGNNIMAKSRREVPVDQGILKASGYVTLPEVDGTHITVELGYGGEGSGEYAVMQHENLQFSHPEGGKAKFLEDPLHERHPHIGNNVANLAKRAFDRGQGPTRSPETPVDPSEGERGAAAVAIGKALRAVGKSIGLGTKRGGRR